MKHAQNPEIPQTRVTLDDVRHRAEAVKSIAVSQVKETARAVTQDKTARSLAIAAGVVVVVAFAAYSMGSRRSSRRDHV